MNSKIEELSGAHQNCDAKLSALNEKIVHVQQTLTDDVKSVTAEGMKLAKMFANGMAGIKQHLEQVNPVIAENVKRLDDLERKSNK